MIVQAETLYGLELQRLAKEEDAEIIQDFTGKTNRSENILRFNLSGRDFSVMERTVRRRKGTLLQKFADSDHIQRMEIANFYSEETDFYFFDRNPDCFNEILDFCRNGQIHCPRNVCPQRFFLELKFWNVSPKFLAPCCAREILAKNPDTDQQNALSFQEDKVQANGPVTSLDENQNSQPKDQFSGTCLSKQRRAVWVCLEDPNSSTLARVLSGLSVFFIFLSVIGLIVGSLPQCQNAKGDPVDVLVHMEQACVAWFTFEYMSRFIVCAERLKFVRSPLNIIDLLSIVPFYFELILSLCGLQPEQLETVKGALLAMRLLRVIRVARVLKLARYSNNMQTFGASLKNSTAEFMMLAISMSVSILLFSTTIYYIEKGTDNSPFTTIPAAFWWCIVTMTTVGYGDMVPTTDFGKFVASFTTVSGVVVLAYPITLIVGKFNTSYKQHTKTANQAQANGPIDTGKGNGVDTLTEEGADPYLEAKELSILLPDGNNSV